VDIIFSSYSARYVDITSVNKNTALLKTSKPMHTVIFKIVNLALFNKE